MAKDNNPNSNKFKVSPWLIYTAILLIFLSITFVTGGSSLNEPGQLRSSDIDNMLNKGQIKNVIIFNNKDAEIYLSDAALKDPTNKKVAKDVFDRPNKGPHYTTKFGDLNHNEVLEQVELAAVSGIRPIYLVILLSHIFLAVSYRLLADSFWLTFIDKKLTASSY